MTSGHPIRRIRLASRSLAAVWLLTGGLCLAQLAVSPQRVELQGVAGGAVIGRTIAVSVPSSVPPGWTATLSDDVKDWLTVKPGSSGTAMVTVAGWWALTRSAGAFSFPAAVSFAAADAAVPPVAVDLTVTLAARLPPAEFSYASGPTGCTQPDGYSDPATCAIADEKPPGRFEPPAVGRTYTDPTFGARVTILTAPVNRHAYSTPSPVSANNKYVFTITRDGFNNVVSTADARMVYRNVPGDTNTGLVWDARDDEVYYWIDGVTIKSRNLRAGRTTTIVDYARDPWRFTAITSGGTGDSSKDDWLSFMAPAQNRICAVDLRTVRTFCADYTAAGGLPYSALDYTLITKGVDSRSSKRYVVLMANPASAVFSVNIAAGRLDFEYRGPENVEALAPGNKDGVCDPGETCLNAAHADVMEDSAGVQYLVLMVDADSPCERTLATLELNKGAQLFRSAEIGGGKRTVMSVFRCGTTWTNYHIGCAKNSPYCVVTTDYSELKADPARTTALPRTPHLSEILVMRENGAEIRRLMQHRSVLFSNEEAGSYWSRPRAAISNDGSLVVADSNFGVPDRQRVTLIETGFGKLKLADGGALNAASLEQAIAPGAIATLRGTTLANCAALAPPGALPDVLCGTQVSFGSRRAVFFSASPSQLNVLVPRRLAPQTGVELTINRADGEQVTILLPAASIGAVAPAAFTYSLEDQVLRASVQNSDYSSNGPPGPDGHMRPLRLGEAGVLYANGLGVTTPAIPDGLPTPAEPLVRAVAEVRVFINDTPQTVFFAGLTPKEFGLYQVNFVLDPATPIYDGDSNVLWLRVNGVDSPHVVVSLAP